jgi:hypothetical protein
METKYFLTQIQHKKDGTWTKGVVIKDTLDGARQSFHAYLGAYGYGQDINTDYVACYIADIFGRITDVTIDNRMEIESAEPQS